MLLDYRLGFELRRCDFVFVAAGRGLLVLVILTL